MPDPSKPGTWWRSKNIYEKGKLFRFSTKMQAEMDYVASRAGMTRNAFVRTAVQAQIDRHVNAYGLIPKEAYEAKGDNDDK